MDQRDAHDEVMVEDQDDVDGILKNIFSRGKYRPKQYEVEAWGPDGPSGGEQMPGGPGSEIGNLLIQTPEWREGLILMLRDCKSEEHVRKCIVFLHTLVKKALDIIEDSEEPVGQSVPFEAHSAPKETNVADWTSVMAGLYFRFESPGTVRSIDYVDVSIGTDTNKDVLAGFCHFLECMLGLSWTHLKMLLNLEESEGKTIFTTVAMLDAGYGISDQVKAPLVRLESKYPSLLKSLGFRKGSSKTLQWQKPFDQQEFDLIFGTLHGLYRSVEETVL